MLFTKNSPPSGFYVYAYLRSDGTPYYIGKGSGGRAWSKQRTTPAPTDSSLFHIIAHNLTEEESYLLENKLICQYGRLDIGTGILRNLNDGGKGGIRGAVRSAETKQKISESKKGVKKSPEVRKRMSDAFQGRPAHNKGKPMSDEQKEKKRLTMTGRKASDETRAKMSESAKKRGMPEMSLETRRKISATLRGRKQVNMDSN